MSTPSLHNYEACEKENRKSNIGHDITWCRVLRKPEKVGDTPESCQKETEDESQTNEQENEVWTDAATKSFPNPIKRRVKGLSQNLMKPLSLTSYRLPSSDFFQHQVVNMSQFQTKHQQYKTSHKLQKTPQHPKVPSEEPLERCDHGWSRSLK